MPSSTGGPAAARNSAPNSEKLRSIRAKFPFLQRWHRLIMLAVMDSHFYWQYEKEGKNARKLLEKVSGEGCDELGYFGTHSNRALVLGWSLAPLSTSRTRSSPNSRSWLSGKASGPGLELTRKLRL
jgi:hypothetical protein